MFSIRVSALLVLVAALALYAYRDWFTSVCGMILLMAVVEHPDFPKAEVLVTTNTRDYQARVYGK